MSPFKGARISRKLLSVRCWAFENTWLIYLTNIGHLIWPLIMVFIMAFNMAFILNAQILLGASTASSP